MPPNKTFASLSLFTDSDGNICVERAVIDTKELRKLFDQYAPNYSSLDELISCIETTNERFNDIMKYMEEHYGTE